MPSPLAHTPTPMSESASENTGAAPVHTEQSHEAIARVKRAAVLATLAITREEERSERDNERNSASVVASSDILNPVKLRVGGKLFEVEKSTLLRFDHTFFFGLFSSGAWQPEADGDYFIDGPAMGFDRILEYLSSGKLSVEGLSDLEEYCVYSSLDHLLIPYRRQWHYSTAHFIEGFRASYVIELKDGRLCYAYENDIIVWNMDTIAIAMTLEGHTATICRVIQLQDGRLCSCSHDKTFKLWSIDSGLCELSLTGHTNGVNSMIQLIDERVCSSGSWDRTIRVWNVFSGVCEMTIKAQYAVFSIAQLFDDRICCGDSGSLLSFYSVLTGECELSWKGHTHYVRAIVCCMDATRICSGSDDGTIKVWSTATGECERTLEGHSIGVTSMVLMQDGRLCSASWDGALKLWNLETGECEKTLSNISNLRCYHEVMQLSDGRLVSCFGSVVHVWS